MNQIEVSIMGQSYRLGCPEGGEARLREAVAQVDREMCAIRDSGKLKARERIAVLAALNLAYVLSERQVAAAAPAAGPSPSPAQASRPDTDAATPTDAAYIDQLIARLDQTLGQDGHLI
ncbi:cell division protein ZapA [Aquabacterium commune]|uniref:Cell division protein ZapA n=1 Tax=Aquabacterium commune TaxID=70586 RepID=A0A4R6RQM3_9BURK|nr:cell division protein ZapA [Aquabacterium commune]TDP88186.1 cell division protein ZapA [Aquabacterium commune]